MCNLFVKSSANAKGKLSFDELRLVDIEKVEFTGSDNKTVRRDTQGINLEQLNYLLINETAKDDTSALTEAAMTEVKQAYIDSTNEEVKAYEQEANNTFAAAHTELLTNMSKIQTIVTAEAAVTSDIELLKAMNAADKAVLINSYNELAATLEKEEELFNAIKDGNFAMLEQQLSTLVDMLSASDKNTAQILNSWQQLKASVLNNADKLSEKAILADFEQSAAKADAFAKVKVVTTEKLNDNYTEQLDALTEELEQTVSSDEYSRLRSILNSMHDTKTSAAWATIRAKLNELNTLLNTNFDNILASISEAAAEPDYQLLLSLLTQLRAVVDSNSVNALLLELQHAAEDSNDAQLNDLLKPLFTGVTTEKPVNLTAITNKDVLDKIDAAFTVTQNNITSNTTVAAVTNAITALAGAISTDYTNDLTDAFKVVKAELDTILVETNVLKLLAKLSSNTDAQATAIIGQISNLIDQQVILVAALESFKDFKNWSKNANATLIKEAILTVWPELLKTRLSEMLDKIELLFEEALDTTNAKSFEDCASELDTLFKGFNKNDALLQLVNKEDVLQLFTQTAIALSAAEYKTSRTDLVKAISSAMPLPALLTDTTITDNAIISKLINEVMTAGSVARKQQALTDLYNELNTTITADTQLLAVISSMLWPNTTSFIANKSILEKDEFYSKLLNYLEAAQNAVLVGSSFSNIDDSAYMTLISKTADEFKKALIAKFDKTASVLPDAFIEKLNELVDVKIELDKFNADFTAFKANVNEDLLKVSAEDIQNAIDESAHEDLKVILNELQLEVAELEERGITDKKYVDTFSALLLEKQLLNELRKIDVDREFYYNVPVEASLAIDFNESNDSLNKSAVNYDINNICNNFVISKLDIDYLTRGLKIARSSLLN